MRDCRVATRGVKELALLWILIHTASFSVAAVPLARGGQPMHEDPFELSRQMPPLGVCQLLRIRERGKRVGWQSALFVLVVLVRRRRF